VRSVNLFHQNAGKNRTLFELHHLLLNFYSILRFPYSDSLIMGAPDWLRHACLEVRNPEDLIQGLPRFFFLAGRSPEHVSREMKRLMGKTPTEFLNELRLDRASQLLCTTALGTLEVSLECGFENLSWFHRLFKSRFGVTPLQYRKRGAAAMANS